MGSLNVLATITVTNEYFTVLAVFNLSKKLAISNAIN